MIDQLSILAKQAGLHDDWFIDNPEIEKFAELIIRDVIRTVARTQPVSPDFDWVILNNYDLEVK